MIISIASGKGGTGKTLVATNLALSVFRQGNVQLLDCDVEEPNAHIFLKPVLSRCEQVCIPVPSIDENKCTYCGKCSDVCAFRAIAVLKSRVLVFPELCHGCGACTYLCPEGAISEEHRETGVVEIGSLDGIGFIHGKLIIGEAMAGPLIREVKKYIELGKTNIIDVPPGTSCPVVEAVKGSDYCVLVTEPTPFGLNDLVLAVEMVKSLNIPCGVVVNKDGIGDHKVEDYCLQENISILLRIPLRKEIAQLYSRGIPFVKNDSQWQEIFLSLYHNIEHEVVANNAERNIVEAKR
jgi:MinD superfamily P-loop ATPase